MTKYEFGDWVVYECGHESRIGRVTECRDHGAFVCYTSGCTASCTPFERLRPATDDEIKNADGGIGFHRFDLTCPRRDESVCSHCCAKKVQNGY